MNDAQLHRQLTLHEGLRLKPYTDTVGKLTIGVGHNLSDLGISVHIAELLLAEDIERVVSALPRALPWWSALDDVRQRVFIDLAFNMGLPTLLTFHNTLAAAARGDWEMAVGYLRDSKWYRQVGERGLRLCLMLLTGVDPLELR